MKDIEDIPNHAELEDECELCLITSDDDMSIQERNGRTLCFSCFLSYQEKTENQDGYD